MYMPKIERQIYNRALIYQRPFKVRKLYSFNLQFDAECAEKFLNGI